MSEPAKGRGSSHVLLKKCSGRLCARCGHDADFHLSQTDECTHSKGADEDPEERDSFIDIECQCMRFVERGDALDFSHRFEHGRGDRRLLCSDPSCVCRGLGGAALEAPKAKPAELPAARLIRDGGAKRTAKRSALRRLRFQPLSGEAATLLWILLHVLVFGAGWILGSR